MHSMKTATASPAKRDHIKALITLSLAITLFLGSSMADAAKCKYQKNELDSFTQEKIVWTKWTSFTPYGNQVTHHGWLSAFSRDDAKLLVMKIVLVEHTSDQPRASYLDGRLIIPQDAKLLIHMADDSIVELAAREQAVGSSRVIPPGEITNRGTGYIVKTTAVINFELNADTINTLMAQGTTDMTISARSRDHGFPFGKKPTDKFQFALGCIQ